MVNKTIVNVKPDILNGDNIDIRQYCKIKTISGGTITDCNYIHGIIFRKNLA